MATTLELKVADARERRDRFACAALTGLLANEVPSPRQYKQVASIAYAMADAMEAERNGDETET